MAHITEIMWDEEVFPDGRVVRHHEEGLPPGVLYFEGMLIGGTGREPSDGYGFYGKGDEVLVELLHTWKEPFYGAPIGNPKSIIVKHICELTLSIKHPYLYGLLIDSTKKLFVIDFCSGRSMLGVDEYRLNIARASRNLAVRLGKMAELDRVL